MTNLYKRTEKLLCSSFIPLNWKESKLNSITKFITCGVAATPEYTNKENGILFLSAQNINDNFKIDLKKSNYITKELHSKLTKSKKPEKGDVLYVRVGATIGKGAVVDINTEFSLYVSLTHIRVNDKILNSYYLNYFISNSYFKNLMLSKQIAGGGVGNLNVDTLKNEYIYLPSLKEQTAIANYLDDKTSKLDEAVSELEKQKSLLIELKKSTIHQAVTKGLDPNVKMKDSGVEWIGEIPEGWIITKFKNIANNFYSGGTPQSNNDTYYTNNGINWISIGDMSTSDLVYTTKKQISLEGIKSKNLKILEKNSLIYSIYATLGKVSFIKNKSTINQALLTFNLKNTVNKKYIFYFLKSFENFVLTKANLNTQYNLNSEIVRNYETLTPTYQDQCFIIDFLDKKTSQIDSSIEEIENKIEKLKEYKKTLINDVVTGKIKVIED